MILTGTNKYGTPVTIDVNNSVGFFGVSRSGKSTQIKKLMRSTVNNPDCLNIVFDIKGEYARELYKPGNKVLSLHDKKGYSTERWNLMREILSSPYPHTTAAEIADTVFSEAIRKSNQPFFPKSARSIFEYYLRFMVYKYAKNPPINKQLIQSILSFDADKLIEAFSAFPELGGIKPLLTGASQTVGGIRAELNQVLSDTFRGNFCGDGDFSICDFVRTEENGTLFLQTSLNEISGSTKAFSIIIELAIKEVLSGSAKAKNIYFFLDEAPLLYSPSLPILLNFGAGYHAYAVIGCQNISQLNAAYGENEANAIVSGLLSHIVLRANDVASAEYFSRRGGKELMTIPRVTTDRKTITTTAEVPAVSTADLSRLNTGEAYYFSCGNPVQFIHFSE